MTGLVAASLVLFVTTSALHAQCTPQQDARVVPAGLNGGASAGSAVAISADGATIAIGAPNDSTSTPRGSVVVFTRDGGVWSQQGPKLTALDGVGTSPRFGSSVSLSRDGNTLLVGARSDSNNDGAAYIFVRSAGAWSRQGPKISFVGSSDEVGRSVSLSGDGNTAVLNATYLWPGTILVYSRSGSTWTQAAAPMNGNLYGSLGTPVAISDDGQTIAVGALSIQSILMFVRSGASWVQEGPPIQGAAGSQFGCSVALSADGAVMLIGARAENGAGAAHIYRKTGQTWVHEGPPLTPGTTSGYGFGHSVSLSADGRTAVVSDYQRHAVFLHRIPTGTSAPIKIVPTGSNATVEFGEVIALSADGTTLLAGSPNEDSGAGGAYVFSLGSILFTSQPANQSIPRGGSATFSVATNSGTFPATYQWRRNGQFLTDGLSPGGTLISGSATPSLTISNVELSDNATAFDCVATVGCAGERSNPATLAVVHACPSDFNHSGHRDAQDIFDFLNAWFAPCP